MDGQGSDKKHPNSTGPMIHRKQRNHASISSVGSTITPSHTVSTSVNLSSTAGIYATATTISSSSPRVGGSSGLLGHYHRGRRRHHHYHHRSATSSLVVTSTTTTTTSATSTAATSHSPPNPLPFFSNLPSAAASIRQRSISSSTATIGRRLRNTIVQSSPRDTTEEGELQEIVVSGRGGVDWIEETSAVERENETTTTAGVVASSTMTDEVQLVFQESGRIRVDRYVPPPPLPPLIHNADVRAGGSEIAGFFHPMLFVPPFPHT